MAEGSSRLDEIRTRLEAQTEFNKPHPLYPIQSCTVCGLPAVDYFNANMGAASSAPTRMEPRCKTHGLWLPISGGLDDDIAWLLEQQTDAAVLRRAADLCHEHLGPAADDLTAVGLRRLADRLEQADSESALG